MALVTVHARLAAAASSASPPLRSAASCTRLRALSTVTGTRLSIRHQQRLRWRRPRRAAAIAASLDLNEDNVRLAIDEAKAEASLRQVDLAELDGPFVKLRLKGKFWHTRATVLARIGNYLKNRIPEILEVEIEDEKQLDDSPAAF
ncbi:hypothetical protein OsJ_29783 [Oryza sativa Japonica Group]|uniref:Uncharacterized protein n=1 Tax=Oryza sativa subsp. japonica TaxID=39947 RepID=A3C006_ORYSJ|nr:hypothetical protein OsJ_29783 [Oryza sativa Japonica Group]